MKLPRRQFLHLAAAAATLPALSHSLSRRATRPDRCTCSKALAPVERLTLSRD
jgi:hypothetical protein